MGEEQRKQNGKANKYYLNETGSYTIFVFTLL